MGDGALVVANRSPDSSWQMLFQCLIPLIVENAPEVVFDELCLTFSVSSYGLEACETIQREFVFWPGFISR